MFEELVGGEYEVGLGLLVFLVVLDIVDVG